MRWLLFVILVRSLATASRISYGLTMRDSGVATLPRMTILTGSQGILLFGRKQENALHRNACIATKGTAVKLKEPTPEIINRINSLLEEVHIPLFVENFLELGDEDFSITIRREGKVMEGETIKLTLVTSEPIDFEGISVYFRYAETNRLLPNTGMLAPGKSLRGEFWVVVNGLPDKVLTALVRDFRPEPEPDPDPFGFNEFFKGRS